MLISTSTDWESFILGKSRRKIEIMNWGVLATLF